MTCHNCRTECKRKGRDRNGTQRYQCRQCLKTFLEPREDHLGGMYLELDKAEMVLKLLLEGNSVSSVERVTEVHHTTILKLLVLAGEKCERIMAEKIRNVKVQDVECDEWARADSLGSLTLSRRSLRTTLSLGCNRPRRQDYRSLRSKPDWRGGYINPARTGLQVVGIDLNSQGHRFSALPNDREVMEDLLESTHEKHCWLVLFRSGFLRVPRGTSGRSAPKVPVPA